MNHGIESSDPSSSPEKDAEQIALIPMVSIRCISYKACAKKKQLHGPFFYYLFFPISLFMLQPPTLQPSTLDPKPSSQNGSQKSAQRKSNVSGDPGSSSISSLSSSSSSSAVQQTAPFAAKQMIVQLQPINQSTSQINTSSSSSNLSTDLLNVSGGDAGNSNSNSSNSTKESSSSKSSSKWTNKGNSSSTKSSSKEQREPKHSKPSRNHSKDSAPSEYDLPSANTNGKLNQNSFHSNFSSIKCIQLKQCLRFDFSRQMATSRLCRAMHQLKKCLDKNSRHPISPNRLLFHLIRCLVVAAVQKPAQMYQLLRNENWNQTKPTPLMI